MVPTSALRETLILILFGIILVPIAAKRAQDARGYWQTFQQLHPRKDLVTTSSSTTTSSHLTPSTSLSLLDVAPPPPIIEYVLAQQNDTSSFLVHASAPPPPSPRSVSGTTISFGSGGAASEVTTGEVMATAAPRTPSSSRTEAQAAGTQAGEGVRLASSTAHAKASEASSKGRWTLIWMGSAIATVAGLMSLC